MDALGNVFLILHGHENGDFQELDDRHSDRSRVESELLQTDDVFQSERSRVSFELQCCQDEDVQLRSWCHDHDDVGQLAQLRPPSFFLIFCFLASSKYQNKSPSDSSGIYPSIHEVLKFTSDGKVLLHGYAVK